MRIHSWCCPSSVDFDKCIMVLFIHYNIHYHDVIWIVFTALKILCASSGLPSSKLPTSRQPLVFLLSLIVLPVPECYIVANVQPFHIGFLYFHGLTVYFVLVLFHCLDVCQFVYPFTYWRTSWWLPVWTVMNKAAAINLVCRFLCKHVFITFGYTPRSAIAGSYYINRFRFVKIHQIALQSGCTSLLSHQEWICVPVAPYPCQHLVLSGLWILAIRIGVLWYLIIVLICISLVIQDVDHLFTCYLSSCSPLQRCLLLLFTPSSFFLKYTLKKL